MNEKPILFSGPMVRAILEGRKTQTRRALSFQPDSDEEFLGPEMYSPTVYDKYGDEQPGPEIFGIYAESGEWGLKCPFGSPGTRLWVRETWRQHYPKTSYSDGIVYRADAPKALGAGSHSDTYKWKPSIHMPRKYCRLFLDVTSVRVERLQDISVNDVQAEGCTGSSHGVEADAILFPTLWDSLNEKKGFVWDSNPYVWVIEFTVGKNDV